MDEIVIKIDWTQINRPKIYRQLTKRYYGTAPRLIIIAAAMALLILSFIVMRATFGPSFFPQNGANYIFPLMCAGIGMRVLNNHWRKKLLHELDSAPVRQGIRSVILTPDGVTSPSSLILGSINWPEITEVVELPDTTLILFSPLEYIPLPDNGLPSGLTRAALLDQIAEWRKASA